MESSVEGRAWRRSPISPLAYTIRMDGVRQANIYPTCRLDKSNRAVYEPEDVWAKRAGLAKIDSKSNLGGKARGMFKQRVIAMSTARVTKENMEAMDRVKETVAVLMKNKERAADIGAVERRILQPRVARKMDRMSAEKRAEFEGRVEAAVERIVYAVKRRYVRRQEKLDEAGVFHPEANAHRVHTQFWADLQNKVNLTDIENAVWANMSSKFGDGKDASGTSTLKLSSSARANTAATPPPPPPVAAAPAAHDEDRSKQHRTASTATRRESKTRSSREEQKRGIGGGEDESEGGSTVYAGFDDPLSASSLSNKFVGIPGYDEVGRVPTLDEFRMEWPRPNSTSPLRSQSEPALGPGGGSKGRRAQQTQQGQGQGQGQGEEGGRQGGAVQDLFKKDEVFRHFKKFYDKADHSRGMRGFPFSAEGSVNGLLQPDLGVIDTIGRHTAEAEEMRNQSRIGQGILLTPAPGQRGLATRRRSRGSGSGPQGGDCADATAAADGGENSDGLVNLFGKSVEACQDSTRRATQHVVNGLAFCTRNRASVTDDVEVSGGERGTKGDKGVGGGREGGRAESRGPPSVGYKGSVSDSRCGKGSLEGSSTSVELQARLEASWKVLHVPAKQKLDFLQKYSTLERALDLPRAASLLEMAAKVIPLREKVMDILHRIERNGEPMSAPWVFSAADEDALCELDCWVECSSSPSVVTESELPQALGDRDKPVSRYHRYSAWAGGDGFTDEDRRVVGRDVESVVEQFGGCLENNIDAEERPEEDQEGGRREDEGARRRQLEALVVTEWLRSIEARLTERCAEACDLASYEVGETITYQGKSVAPGLPHAALEKATTMRVEREGRVGRKSRGRH